MRYTGLHVDRPDRGANGGAWRLSNLRLLSGKVLN